MHVQESKNLKKEEIVKTIDTLLNGICGKDEVCYKDMLRKIDSNSALPKVWKKIAKDIVLLKRQQTSFDVNLSTK